MFKKSDMNLMNNKVFILSPQYLIVVLKKLYFEILYVYF